MQILVKVSNFIV